jgi:hypothetical protein
MSDPVPSRPWAVFVDAQEPRILMLAQQAPDGYHWCNARVDEAVSTIRVKVWVDETNAPIMIEASGADNLGELETEVLGITRKNLLWSPTLGDPNIVPSWVWWHDSLAVEVLRPPEPSE